MAETVRRKIHELEPQRSVYDVALLEGRMGDAYAQNRGTHVAADTLRADGAGARLRRRLRHTELRRRPSSP